MPSEPMTRILLVRHAPTPETGDRLTGRASGVFLDEPGRQAARAAARALADVEVEAIYSSPIERTLETARIIAQPHRLTPITDLGLTEMDFGAWTGQTLESLRRTKEWGTVQAAPSRFTFPEGESFVEAQRRSVDSVERIAQDHPGKIVAAVSHADIIKLIMSYYLGQALDLFQRLRISTASISELQIEDSHPPVVVSINGTGVTG
ncbi:MAG: phosphoglycerate mutase [Acidimicrobiia bacterium]|nr:phosphoglycerate mutase [Acidimicrobiia bacterium]